MKRREEKFTKLIIHYLKYFKLYDSVFMIGIYVYMQRHVSYIFEILINNKNYNENEYCMYAVLIYIYI